MVAEPVRPKEKYHDKTIPLQNDDFTVYAIFSS